MMTDSRFQKGAMSTSAMPKATKFTMKMGWSRSLPLKLLIVILAGCGHTPQTVHTILQKDAPQRTETQLLAVYQPWFGFPEHIDVGYSTLDPAVLSRQVHKARELGITAFVVDWYSTRKPEYDHAYALLQATAAKQGFRAAIMYDEPEGEPESSTDEAITALDYIWEKYAGPNAAHGTAYLQYQERPVIFVWPRSRRTDWNAVRRHIDQWPVHPILINRFSNTPYPNAFDGYYAWIDPGQPGWSSDGSNWGRTYLDNFYEEMTHNYSGKIIVAGAWPGFDDSRAAWGTHRKIAQRCGKTFSDTMQEFRRFSTPDHPIPFLMIETWNDYEEGSAIENGIQSCSATVSRTSDSRIVTPN
jgi:hypothetical protein